MKLKDLYALAVQMGIDADPRGAKEVAADLARRKAHYKKVDAEEKKYYDEEQLNNPYFDSRLLYARSLNDDIKTILVGIDMEHTELLLAAELNRSGHAIDLVLSHHPEGSALIRLGDDMHLQNPIVEELGVPINVAEKVLQPRVTQIRRGLHPTNFIRSLHTAELLGINYACTHTITDNMAYQFMNRLVGGKKHRTVGDVIHAIMKEPEYQMASKMGNGPMVMAGSKEALAGRVAVTGFTGGTSGHEDIYEKLSQAGVGTIVAMHMSEKHYQAAEKHHLNVVVAGHMASDSLGVNQLLDAFEKKGIRIIPCGMFRVSRVKRS
ncbi:NGG1p interacting factor NIF3 [Candidatus Peregrinibacteria bacterium]|nr:MAG: NGG1p interacting factor NIF3 [Candidatus Peregrinibacteria bacterium]